MATRLDLQTLFENILGSSNVYFQPPASVQMKYDAIVYSLSNIETTRANNAAYKLQNRYMVTLITRDPDSELVSKLASLPLCRFVRYYAADNLNHYVFEIYI